MVSFRMPVIPEGRVDKHALFYEARPAGRTFPGEAHSFMIWLNTENIYDW
jgi:hypothetical protein